MSLSSYKPRRQKIEFDGGSFQVRALSAPDVATIIESHQEVVDRVFARLRSNADNGVPFTEATATELMMGLIQEAPTLIGNVIALAADEATRDGMKAAMSLPLSLQIHALQIIGRLTFKDIAAVKKFGADVMMLLKGILPASAETTAA